MSAAAAVDHLIWGVSDLRSGAEEIARRLGVTPAAGGRHPGRGSANCLLGLGGGAYLEVLGPDPGLPPQPRLPLGLDRISGNGLIGWAVRTRDLEGAADSMRRSGWDPGALEAMERQAPDGRRLSWRLTARESPDVPEAVPFLIDWGETPHPASTAPQGVRLVRLRLEHPRPEWLRELLSALGLRLETSAAETVRLVAELKGPAGPVVLS